MPPDRRSAVPFIVAPAMAGYQENPKGWWPDYRIEPSNLSRSVLDFPSHPAAGSISRLGRRFQLAPGWTNDAFVRRLAVTTGRQRPRAHSALVAMDSRRWRSGHFSRGRARRAGRLNPKVQARRSAHGFGNWSTDFAGDDPRRTSRVAFVLSLPAVGR